MSWEFSLYLNLITTPVSGFESYVRMQDLRQLQPLPNMCRRITYKYDRYRTEMLFHTPKRQSGQHREVGICRFVFLSFF